GFLRYSRARHGVHPAAARRAAGGRILQRCRDCARRWRSSAASVYGSIGVVGLENLSGNDGRLGAEHAGRKEDVMGRAKEEPRGRLASLQDLIAGSGKLLV